MDNMEANAKWQCPKCGVGLPYNPTYKLEGLCSTCRAYEDSDRLLGGYRQNKKVKMGLFPSSLSEVES